MRVNCNNGWQISESWNDGSWSSLPAQESTSDFTMEWKTVGSQVWVFEELEVAHCAMKTSGLVCNQCWDKALKCCYIGGFSKQLPVMILWVTASLGNDCMHIKCLFTCRNSQTCGTSQTVTDTQEVNPKVAGVLVPCFSHMGIMLCYTQSTNKPPGALSYTLLQARSYSK